MTLRAFFNHSDLSVFIVSLLFLIGSTNCFRVLFFKNFPVMEVFVREVANFQLKGMTVREWDLH